MRFWTVTSEYQAQLEDRNSRFLAHIVPFAVFDQTLADLKSAHRKANHHVTAFRTMQDDNRIIEGAKDDGEPAGTSGMPILKTLEGHALVDVGVIVVRYFGGTKLGGGGLARAYSGATARAIEAADLVLWQRIISKTFSCTFPDISPLEADVERLKLTVLARQFSESGQTVMVSGPEDQIKKLAQSWK